MQQLTYEFNKMKTDLKSTQARVQYVTHTHTLTLSLTHTHTHTLTLLSLSHTHSLTHTHSSRKLHTDLSTQTRKANDAQKLLRSQKPELERLRGMEKHMQEAQQRFVVTRDPHHTHVMHIQPGT